MPQQATADFSDSKRAPEYSGASGQKTSTDAHPVTETATEARQAVTGHGARYVLIFSLGGVILAFALIYALFWS